MNDYVIPGSVLGGLIGLFAVVRYALTGYRQAQAEFMPRTECALRHSGTDVGHRVLIDRMEKAEAAIVAEAKARHDLRDALQPIALKVERLDASMQGVREAVTETRELVREILGKK